MRSPKISVIIPTYNRAAMIGRAVRSALQQIREGDEIIVVDDGSTDGTEQALAAFRDRITYLRIPNGGAGKARNKGLALASNPLVAFLDSDDEWQPHKLDLQRALMEARPDLVYCFSNFAHMNGAGQVQHNWIASWHGAAPGPEKILGPGVSFSSLAGLPAGVPDFAVHIGSLYLAQLRSHYVFTSTVIVRRQHAGATLEFAQDLSIVEDMTTYARMASAGPVAYLACETARQHAHDGPRLTGVGDLARATATLAMFERVWGADPAFLKQHGELYARAVQEQRQRRVRALLGLGRTAEARRELRDLEDSPVLYQALSLLPGFLMRGLVWGRERIRASRDS